MDATVNEIELEIEAGRARLEGVLNQFADRLHPVAFVEDVIRAAKRSSAGGDLYDLSLNAVRRHLIPVLLICAGVSMLLAWAKQPAKLSDGNLSSTSALWARSLASGLSFREQCRELGWSRATAEHRRRRACVQIAAEMNQAVDEAGRALDDLRGSSLRLAGCAERL